LHSRNIVIAYDTHSTVKRCYKSFCNNYLWFPVAYFIPGAFGNCKETDSQTVGVPRHHTLYGSNITDRFGEADSNEPLDRNRKAFNVENVSHGSSVLEEI